MRTLFTKPIKAKLLKCYEYIAGLFVLFIALSYFSTPTFMVRTMGVSSGVIEEIMLKREMNYSISAPRSHSDYFEIKFRDMDIPFRCYEVEKIENYGPQNLEDKFVNVQINKKGDYNIIRELNVNGKLIVEKNDSGFFPFLLFVGLSIIFLIWSAWGFYITYFASEEKRLEILDKYPR